MYETKGNRLECTYIRTYGKLDEVLDIEKNEDEFTSFAKDKELQEQILSKFSKF